MSRARKQAVSRDFASTSSACPNAGLLPGGKLKHAPRSRGDDTPPRGPARLRIAVSVGVDVPGALLQTQIYRSMAVDRENLHLRRALSGGALAAPPMAAVVVYGHALRSEERRVGE